MKEYLKKISLVLATCTFLFSCDKFLEENPKDKLPEDDVYNSISEVYLNAVASLYTYVGGYSDSQGLQGTGRGVYDLNTFTTDEAIIPTRGGDWYDGGFWQGLFLHDWGIENDAIQATWEYLYKVVMLSNKSLERIDKFAETHSDAELPAYRAEVRAMRAMYYYYLLDLFGRVPLVQSSSPAMKDIVQSERKTVFEFIFKELQEVAPLLSEVHSNQTGPYYGRITRPVVTFLLAKLALNAEVYTDNDWTDNERPDGKNIKFMVDGNELNAFFINSRHIRNKGALHLKLWHQILTYIEYYMNIVHDNQVHNRSSRRNQFPTFRKDGSYLPVFRCCQPGVDQ